ncbi:uncharacterized protein LOC118486284 [Helianthus annuus]|uniref:uncharacterized protein LOC118486284 n=1 Tax=Helianthus annuus TaxID=4232 RepID=UPI0016530891|nr:uncharacterized protein LOC118486284 [Helianthus annuus]
MGFIFSQKNFRIIPIEITGDSNTFIRLSLSTAMIPVDLFARRSYRVLWVAMQTGQASMSLKDIPHLFYLKEAGATDAILENAETILQLGSKLLKGLGDMFDDVNFLIQIVRDSMELQNNCCSQGP